MLTRRHTLFLLSSALLVPGTAWAASPAELVRQQLGSGFLLQVWATWCGACKGSLDDLAEAKKATGGTVVGLVVDDDHAKARAYLSGQSLPWSNHLVSADEVRALKVGFSSSLPTSSLIDASGKLVRSFSGAGDVAKYTAALKEAASLGGTGGITPTMKSTGGSQILEFD